MPVGLGALSGGWGTSQGRWAGLAGPMLVREPELDHTGVGRGSPSPTAEVKAASGLVCLVCGLTNRMDNMKTGRDGRRDAGENHA